MNDTRMIDKVGEVAGDAKSRVREGYDWSKAKIHDLTVSSNQTIDKAKDTAGDLYRRGGEAVEYVRESAASRPFLTLAIAAAIGYGIGYFTRRR